MLRSKDALEEIVSADALSTALMFLSSHLNAAYQLVNCPLLP